MRTIYKYNLAVTDGIQKIQMPQNAEIISAQAQGNQIAVWAVVETIHSNEEREFVVYGTGDDLDVVGKIKHLGTVQFSSGALVFHVFELV